MRRVVLFAAFLLLLGLTTATAASFDVQPEEITAFTDSVTVTPPPTTPPPATPLYLNSTGALSGAPLGSLTTETFATGTKVWQGSPASGFLVAGKTVVLTLFANGGSGSLIAELFECVSEACTLVRSGTDSWTGAGQVRQVQLTTPGPAPAGAIQPGRVVRLRITSTSGSWQMQYDKSDPGKDANLSLVPS